jgi:hypothetical protein
MHDQTHRRRVYPTIKKYILEAKAFCSMFSELGLVTIRENVRSVHFERQRRKLHIWTVTAPLARKFQVSLESPQIRSVSLL